MHSSDPCGEGSVPWSTGGPGGERRRRKRKEGGATISSALGRGEARKGKGMQGNVIACLTIGLIRVVVVVAAVAGACDALLCSSSRRGSW